MDFKCLIQAVMHLKESLYMTLSLDIFIRLAISTHLSSALNVKTERFVQFAMDLLLAIAIQLIIVMYAT